VVGRTTLLELRVRVRGDSYASDRPGKTMTLTIDNPIPEVA
jgi:hypothetical protein